jgi:hypothetical protein
VSKKKRPAKKHNPLKNQQMKAQTNLEQIRASSWYAGGSWQESIGTVAGNFDYPALFTPAVAKRIMNQKNQWSCLFIAFIDDGYQLYTKAEEVEPITRFVTRRQAEQIIEPKLQLFRENQHRQHCISISWFMVPAPDADLLAIQSQIADLLETEGAADPILCGLASDQRWTEIEQRQAQQEAA